MVTVVSVDELCFIEEHCYDILHIAAMFENNNAQKLYFTSFSNFIRKK